MDVLGTGVAAAGYVVACVEVDVGKAAAVERDHEEGDLVDAAKDDSCDDEIVGVDVGVVEESRFAEDVVE